VSCHLLPIQLEESALADVHGLRERLGSLLRQIVADATLDEAMQISAGEFFGVSGVIPMRRTVVFAFKGAGRHADLRCGGQLRFEPVQPGSPWASPTCTVANAPAVTPRNRRQPTSCKPLILIIMRHLARSNPATSQHPCIARPPLLRHTLPLALAGHATLGRCRSYQRMSDWRSVYE
jgi:hypothetical protein